MFEHRGDPPSVRRVREAEVRRNLPFIFIYMAENNLYGALTIDRDRDRKAPTHEVYGSEGLITRRPAVGLLYARPRCV